MVCCEQDPWVSSRGLVQYEETKETLSEDPLDEASLNRETEEIWKKMSQGSTFTSKNRSNSDRSLLTKKKKNQVLLEGYVEGGANESDPDDLRRTKSLTDDDLDELKGCLDLGFGFSYDEIPELCNTLPALELCYSMSQKFLDRSPERSSSPPVSDPSSGPIANWKISSPGDHPEDVKARLKFWAQAVACTVKLCS